MGFCALKTPLTRLHLTGNAAEWSTAGQEPGQAKRKKLPGSTSAGRARLKWFKRNCFLEESIALMLYLDLELLQALLEEAGVRGEGRGANLCEHRDPRSAPDPSRNTGQGPG